MPRFFPVYIPAPVAAIIAADLCVLTGCYIIASYLMLDVDPEVYLTSDRGLVNIFVVVGSILLGLYLQDMYTELRVRSHTLLIQQVCTAIGLAFLLQSVVNYTSPGTLIPRWLMLTGSTISLVVLTGVRSYYSSAVLANTAGKSILFLGRNETVRQIADRIAHSPELGMTVAGFLDQPNTTPAGPQPGPVLGTIADLKEVAERVKPDQIVIGLSERRQNLPMYALLDMKFGGISIEEASSLYETTHHRVSVQGLRPSDLIFSNQQRDLRFLSQIQTLYSWVLALIGFVLTLPVMVVVYILVKLTSPGPGLYSQTRSGLNGEPFKLYKFRSMRVDAESATGAVWASKNDPRITPIGRWLRLLRLDELPQFINVLRGEMNMVGPRPERPEFVRTLQEQIPFYRQRLLVKPGLTGWAQINHKYGDTIEDTITKLEYDLYYIKHCNMALDFYIMFQTAKVMLLHRGAQ